MQTDAHPHTYMYDTVTLWVKYKLEDLYSDLLIAKATRYVKTSWHKLTKICANNYLGQKENRVQYSTVMYYTVQDTVQYSTVQYSTVQYSTVLVIIGVHFF